MTQKMVVTREYPRGSMRYPPGSVIEVSEASAKAMMEANPPFGRPVRELAPPSPPRVPGRVGEGEEE